MTKYRVELKRTVRQEAVLYVDAKSADAAIETMQSQDAIWHNIGPVKNTFEAHAERSEDVDQRDTPQVEAAAARARFEENRASHELAHDKHVEDVQEALDTEFGS